MILAWNKIKYILLIFLLIFVGFNSHAQFERPYKWDNYDSTQSQISLYGNYAVNATSATNELVNKLFLGGYIDRDIKKRTLDRLKNENRLGVVMDYGIYYAFQKDSMRTRFFLNAGEKTFMNTNFSKDLYQLTFYGNKIYEGKRAYMNNFNANYLNFQRLQLGIMKTIGEGAALYGLGISALKGINHWNIDAKVAELYTAQYGDYLSFNTAFEANRADTANTSGNPTRGLGASIDLFAEIPFTGKKYSGIIIAEVNDLGSIYWNKNAMHYEQDSSFYFDGISINNIFDFKDSSFSNISTDSIVNSIAQPSRKNYYTTIPASFKIEMITRRKKIEWIKGFHYLFNANYKGLYYIKLNYHFNSTFMLSGRLAYGGYGILHSGIDLIKDFGKGFIFQISTNNIGGYFVPAYTTGQGLNIRMHKYF